MNKKMLLAGVGALALVLSACGGADTTSPTEQQPGTGPASTSAPAGPETTPAEPAAPETTPASPEPVGSTSPASGDGLQDDLFAKMAEGMKGVKTMKMTSEGTTGTTYQYTDLRDPKNIIVYQVSEFSGSKMEVVTDNEKASTRVDGGAWTTQPHSAETRKLLEESQQQFDPEKLGFQYKGIELLDAGERKYKVSLGGGEGTGTLDTIMWLDENYRVAKQEVTVGDIVQTMTMEYDVPIDIPAVS